ncbi:MAG: hypothetical protein GXP48_00865 [Acidobacteria bacterium]|nr:hypothetical protein [Acidobacteriota bacterium]
MNGAGAAVARAKLRVLRLDMATWRISPVALHTSAGESFTVSTDDRGRFHFSLERPIEVPQLDRAGLEVVCEAAGYAARALPVQPRATQEMEMKLDTERTFLAGRVTRNDGSPVANVPVTVLATTETGPFVDLIRTDNQGQFRTRNHLPLAASYFVIINEPEYQPAIQQVAWKNHQAVALRLSPGRDVPVAVRDAATGTTVATARVLAMTQEGPLHLQREAESTPHAFILRNLPPDGEVSIRVSAADYMPATVDVDVADASAKGAGPMIVQLEPAGSIAGRVTDKENRPVAQVRVLALGADSSARSASVFTHADGSFRIDNLTRGASYTVTCEARGFAPWWQKGVTARKPAASLQIRLDRGAVVSGYVLHDDDTPAKGVILRAIRVTADPDNPKRFAATPEAQKECRTARDGSYIFRGLAEGSYLIGPVVASFPKVGHWQRGKPAPPLPLHSGDELTNLDFYVANSGALRIELKDVEQVSGLQKGPKVTFTSRVSDRPFYGPRATVRGKGRGAGVFEVKDIAEGVYDVEVRFDGFRPVRRKAVKIRGDDETLLKVGELSRGATLRLHVVNRRGSDLPNLLVRLFRITRNDIDPDHQPTLAAIPEDNPSLVVLRTDAAGQASVDGLEPGTYQLHITEEEGPTYQGPYYYEEFKIADNDNEDQGVIDKTVVFDEGGPATFVLEDAQGNPLPGASMNLTRVEQDFAGIHLAGLADANGRCVIQHVTPGLYIAEVFASAAKDAGLVAEPYFQTTVVVRGSSPIEIRLP